MKTSDKTPTKSASQSSSAKTAQSAAESAAGRPKVARRDVVAAAGACVGLFVLGAGASLSAAPVIRPPGGQNESEFSSLCIRCGRCEAVCHTGAIRSGKFSEGLRHLRTPVLDFSHADCDFCRECINVCPTGALKPFSGQTVTIGRAELTESCIALRNSGCTKCYEECPYDAVTLDGKRAPLIHADRCTGCGVCERVCPALVLQSLRGSPERGIVVRALEKSRPASGGSHA